MRSYGNYIHLCRTLFIRTLCSLLCFEIVSCCEVRGESPKKEELIDSVIAGNRQNKSQIHTLRGMYESVLENSGAKDPRVIVVEEKKRGTVVTKTIQPRSIQTISCLFKENIRRFDSFEEGRINPDSVWIYQETKVIEYHPKDGLAWTRSPAGPGHPFLDPRDYIFGEPTESLENILRRGKILTTEIRGSGGSQEELVLVLLETPLQQRVLIECNPALNCLPVRVTYQHDDQSICFSTKVEYCEVTPGSSWFPKYVVRHAFKKGVTRDNPEGDGWTQRLSLRLKGELSVNQNVKEDELEITLPNGTKLFDNLNRQVRVLAKTDHFGGNKEAKRSRILYFYLGGGILAFIGLVVTAIVRFRRFDSKKEDSK